MHARTEHVSGSAGSAEPASPGTYGLAPGGFRLPAETRLGRVRLQVADLTRSLAFYQEVLGLRAVERTASDAVLAAEHDDTPLVELQERPGARAVPNRGALGLYHFAILVPDRASLGRFVRHLGEIGARAGAADHLVSESFYLQDPDNLGIEVYADRPRGTWRRIGRELMMATDPVDAAGLIKAAGDVPWTSMPRGTTIGHVHLHVGDLEQAANFYSEAMGFDRTVWHYPGAMFLAADGYHHHLGTNTWAGTGAAPAGPQDARLLEWTLYVPDESSVSAIAENLTAGGYTAEIESGSGAGQELVARDPWGTQVRVQVQPTGTSSGG